MRVVTVDFSDPTSLARYDALFEGCPNALIQQSSYWAQAVAPLGPDRPIFLLAEHEGRDIAGLPLYLYEGPSGTIMTSVPQPGPMGGVFAAELADGAREQAFAALLNNGSPS